MSAWQQIMSENLLILLLVTHWTAVRQTAGSGARAPRRVELARWIELSQGMCSTSEPWVQFKWVHCGHFRLSDKELQTANKLKEKKKSCWTTAIARTALMHLGTDRTSLWNSAACEHHSIWITSLLIKPFNGRSVPCGRIYFLYVTALFYSSYLHPPVFKSQSDYETQLSSLKYLTECF